MAPMRASRNPPRRIFQSLGHRHKLPTGFCVGKTSVLGGLHHEYFLVKEACLTTTAPFLRSTSPSEWLVCEILRNTTAPPEEAPPASGHASVAKESSQKMYAMLRFALA